jgi:hypothetical protein
MLLENLKFGKDLFLINKIDFAEMTVLVKFKFCMRVHLLGRLNFIIQPADFHLQTQDLILELTSDPCGFVGHLDLDICRFQRL